MRAAPLLEPLQQLRRALLHRAGGDKVMAQMMAIVHAAVLDKVLVAAELALETGPPWGRVGVEHVVNVPARLNATPAPQSAAMTLQVSMPPLASTDGAQRQLAHRQRGHPMFALLQIGD